MLEVFATWSKPRVLLLCLTLVLLLGLVDYLTGTEFSFSIFYLPPIVLATWHLNKRTGILIATASAVAWVLADWLAGANYSNPLVPFWNTAVRFGFFLITLSLVDNVKSRLEMAERFSLSDSLTGVANSRKFYLAAEAAIARSRRYGEPISVAYIDLDNFKLVNDRYGHSQGDRALRLVGSIMRTNTRQTDTVARLGGDEFSILLPEVKEEDARKGITRLKELLTEEMRQQALPITFSIGVVTYTQAPVSVEHMIHAADALMYKVKHNGKNNIGFDVKGDESEEVTPWKVSRQDV